MISKIAAFFRRPASLSAPAAHTALVTGALLLDVRESQEWRAGHAPEARHLVLSQLQDHLSELPTRRPIVTVCRSGRRSVMAAQLLTRHGYTVSNLAGGMHAWARAGLPVVTRGGKPGQII